MSLISIAQRETFHISFVQFTNKGYETDNLTPELKIVKYWKGMWHIEVKK